MASYEEGADADWGGRGWCWDGFDRSNQIITLTNKYNMYIVHTLFGVKITFTLPDVVLSGRRTVRVVPQGREVSPILMETVLR